MSRSLVAGAGLVAAGLLLIAGCATDGPDGDGPTGDRSATGLAVDRDAAVAAAIDVRAEGCGPRVTFGSGSVIDNGDIVTAAHVVAGSTAIEVIDVDGKTVSAQAILFDPDLDLAVLRADRVVGTPQPVRPTVAGAGEPGLIVLPRLVDGSMTVEVVDVHVVRRVNIATTDIYLADDVTRDGYEIEGLIDHGDSGAMVVLAGGGAGIVWARSNQNSSRAWAIDLPADVRSGAALHVDRVPVDVGSCRDA